MIFIKLLIGCILFIILKWLLIIIVVGLYDGFNGVNRFKQNTVDTEILDKITFLEELKQQYIDLSYTIETDYKNNKIKKAAYQSKMITLDKQIYNIDVKLNKLYNSLD